MTLLLLHKPRPRAKLKSKATHPGKESLQKSGGGGGDIYWSMWYLHHFFNWISKPIFFTDWVSKSYVLVYYSTGYWYSYFRDKCFHWISKINRILSKLDIQQSFDKFPRYPNDCLFILRDFHISFKFLTGYPRTGKEIFYENPNHVLKKYILEIQCPSPPPPLPVCTDLNATDSCA